MQFNSPHYIIFLATVLIAYCNSQLSLRPYILLIASYLFYAFISLKFTIILIFLTSITYIISLLIKKNKDKKAKNLFFWTGILFALFSLFSFKYIGIFLTSINYLIGATANDYQLIEMAGISFISFHVIAYLIDIYYESVPVENSFTRFAVFISFFPKLLQGPIERAENFIPQLETLKKPTLENLQKGAFIIIWGLFLKTVVADRLSIYVDTVYQNTTSATSMSALLAVITYTFQLYFDWVGYTKIAIGSAQMFGIKLIDNFNNPLSAVSCTDFWRRWHISLSSWLRDYLFIPLSMTLREFGKFGLVIATMVTFVLCGLWHGPSIGFILFGVCHGIWLSLELIFKSKKKNIITIRLNPRLNRIVSNILTLSGLSLTFVFFRSKDLNDAIIIFRKCFTGITIFFTDFTKGINQILIALTNLQSNEYPWFTVQFNSFVLLVALSLVYIVRRYNFADRIQRLSIFWQLIAAQGLVLSILSLGIVSSPSFVYFQF